MYPQLSFLKQSSHHSLSIKSYSGECVQSTFFPLLIFVIFFSTVTMGFLYSNIPLVRYAISLLLAIFMLIPGSLCCDSCLYKSKLVYHSEPPLPEIINGMYVERISPLLYILRMYRESRHVHICIRFWEWMHNITCSYGGHTSVVCF